MATPIGTLGTVPSLTVGGVVFTDLSNLIVLKAYLLTSTNHSSMRKVNGTAGYQVTTGKTMTIRAFNMIQETSANTSANFALSYTDNDCGSDSNTAPSNQVYEGGAATIARYGTWPLPTSGTGFQMPSFFAVPAQKYCTLNVVAATVITTVHGFAYEA